VKLTKSFIGPRRGRDPQLDEEVPHFVPEIYSKAMSFISQGSKATEGRKNCQSPGKNQRNQRNEKLT
jgi:hypothetical protein